MRKGKIKRKTRETNISVEMELDGVGRGEIDTKIPFMDHMLNLLARHGLFDLKISGQGDREVDDHHLVEDLGICLGNAVKKALGDKEGIARYGAALAPMDESLASVALDISGRPCLVYHAELGEARIGAFDPSLLREFFKAFSDHGGITLHINVLYGKNNHHMAEAAFKAFALALRSAVQLDERIQGVMSTKGLL
ncbi:MAG TPA: imidazoleglycerol-phosphate dehydratase HisB [Syntrophales bacterium]|jgi:imidazoleglycerol-phosphate dehydratase|nr:imidazoleglycerol-phosphate dehydratase HisB [Syntrophales bacterium]HOD97518.1 imidazoleglycerol-phosphate dehydratase HisB [Syntrophales bacterium]HOH72258.1 imidazoleglycerol-phosphate dehydratase HisB [Syntrophales bacterium]HPN08192.1 imidazoleglycerol-phosphate dehydratase HisB [Syntrophales bacterium]HPX81867.1 imidazoleglycerol-phosphate dehydratase HisB [Syntrophales bacterium]